MEDIEDGGALFGEAVAFGITQDRPKAISKSQGEFCGIDITANDA